jgi:hypothetical protein
MLTPRVILCQVLFSVMIYAASKFGKKPLVVTTVVLLLITLVHLFSPALLILQTTVILATAALCYHRNREREVDEIVTAFRNILGRLTGK